MGHLTFPLQEEGMRYTLMFHRKTGDWWSCRRRIQHNSFTLSHFDLLSMRCRCSLSRGALKQRNLLTGLGTDYLVWSKGSVWPKFLSNSMYFPWVCVAAESRLSEYTGDGCLSSSSLYDSHGGTAREGQTQVQKWPPTLLHKDAVSGRSKCNFSFNFRGHLRLGASRWNEHNVLPKRKCIGYTPMLSPSPAFTLLRWHTGLKLFISFTHRFLSSELRKGKYLVTTEI